MVFINFIYALGFVIITALAFAKELIIESRSFAFYAGALLICAFFSLKNQRHGIVGAAVLSLLSLFSTCSRLWDLIQTSHQPNNVAFLLNAFATVFAATFLFICYVSWQKSKRLAFLAELSKDEGNDIL